MAWFGSAFSLPIIHHQYSYHDRDPAKALPVEEASRLIVNAIASGKREEVFPAMGKHGQYLRFFFPSLYDKLVVMALARAK